MLKEFTIDEQYLETVDDSQTVYKYDLSKELTNGQLVDILTTSNIRYTIRGVKDHPVFLKLRDHLESCGYIKTQRLWLNGDTVLKRFKLNGKLFKPGEKFVSAGAMKFHLKHK